MNAAGQRVFLLALIINLDNLVVFDESHACFVARRRYHQLFGHYIPPLGPEDLNREERGHPACVPPCAGGKLPRRPTTINRSSRLPGRWRNCSLHPPPAGEPAPRSKPRSPMERQPVRESLLGPQQNFLGGPGRQVSSPQQNFNSQNAVLERCSPAPA